MKRVIISRIALLGVVALALFMPSESRAQRAQMELLDTKLSVTQDSINIVGQVKNVSAREVSGVTVVYDFQNAAGKSVRMVQGMLETDPLGPNKTSEFKASTKYSADIKRFNVTFQQMFGGKLVTKDSRKP